MAVIASVQRAGLNLRDYLGDVFTRLVHPAFTTGQLATLLPGNWEAARPAAATVATVGE
jgi:hypothetical protein